MGSEEAIRAMTRYHPYPYHGLLLSLEFRQNGSILVLVNQARSGTALSSSLLNQTQPNVFYQFFVVRRHVLMMSAMLI